MRISRTLSKFILVIVLLSTGLWITNYISMRYFNGTMWVYFLSGVLIAAFLAEAMKSIDGQSIFWVSLSPHDKFITIVDFLLVLVSGLLPLKIGISLGFVLVFVLFGYAVAWFITEKYGSENLRGKLFFTPTKK